MLKYRSSLSLNTSNDMELSTSQGRYHRTALTIESYKVLSYVDQETFSFKFVLVSPMESCETSHIFDIVMLSLSALYPFLLTRSKCYSPQHFNILHSLLLGNLHH